MEKGPALLFRADLIAAAAMMPSPPPPPQRRRTTDDSDDERSLDGPSLGWIEMPLPPISSELWTEAASLF